ncbi:hypothetical protein WA026_008972 [Henosepilachna vigintioctopunctata]|uniref:Peptidase M14 domain-containing protein n=1 Tax=Henosepilachna vigintioctopunctata TaxID=420089 RepID=A0AAW1VBR7_9CUCU
MASISSGYDPLQHTSIYQRKEDSDDSDGESGMGNVNRFIVRPPGHSGKAKRGHLCFDASFETGNLGRVDLVNEFEYDLYIRPDTCSPRFRFWFNFTVDNVKQDQRVIFNIVNMSKGRNLFNNQMTPLVKSTSRNKWQRIPKEYVFYYKSLNHHGHYVLSFSFGFDKEDEVFQFALASPYSYSKLQTFLKVLESKASYLKNNFKRECIANSLQNRRLEAITVGANNKTDGENKKRIVAVMARIHPGESPSSFVCQGLLEILISSSSLATALREHIAFKIMPMMNPDGVFVGNYRSDILGVDLNRSWHVATPFSHPNIYAILQMLKSLDNSEQEQLDFVIDIHAHSSLKGCFIYGNTYEDVYRYERHILFPKLLAASALDYGKDQTMFNSDTSKNGTSRRHLCCALSSKVNSYTLEVSIFGYTSKDSDQIIPYTEDSCILIYKRCGMNLIKAFLEYYHCIGAIPLQPVKEIPTKNRRSRRRKLRKPELIRSSRCRETALVHFKDININYDSEISIEDNSYKMMKSPRRILKSTNRIYEEFTPKFQQNFKESDPPILVVMPEPTLSIIDLNEML